MSFGFHIFSIAIGREGRVVPLNALAHSEAEVSILFILFTNLPKG